jgi:hypothetical protein
MVQVRIGNQTYDAITVPSCHTCTHPARMEIEHQIALGEPYRKIAEHFSEVEVETGFGRTETLPKLSHTSIRNHFVSGHMPMEAEGLRRISERRAAQIGVNIEEGAARLVDGYVLNEAVVHLTHQRLINGDIAPDVRDGIAAAKFLQDVEDRQNGGFEAEAWSQAMMIYFEEAQQVMDPGQWQQFALKIRRNPILRALEAKMNPQEEETDGYDDDDVLDAEVVEPGEVNAHPR